MLKDKDAPSVEGCVPLPIYSRETQQVRIRVFRPDPPLKHVRLINRRIRFRSP